MHTCNAHACRVPPASFSVRDVKRLVGSKRVIDVMDTCTQEGSTMTMQEWAKYYESQPRDKLLNVISLEFSCTKLSPLVEPPEMVRDVNDRNWKMVAIHALLDLYYLW